MVEGQEKTKEFIIRNKLGLHLRPAGLLVKTANKYISDITVEKDGVQVDGKSIIAVTTLNASKDSVVTIKACGPDAEQALQELERLIVGNFEDV